MRERIRRRPKRSPFRPGGATAVLVSAVALTLAAPAAAHTVRVRNTRDHGRGSLRQAVAHAQPGDTVRVPKGSYRLRNEIELTSAVNIRGSGASKTTIDGKRLDRVFELTSTAAPVRISGLTLTGGRASSGGAILSAGSLSLDHTRLTGNVATSPSGGSGGAVAAMGALTVSHSTLRHNRAIGNGTGGAILFDPVEASTDGGLFIIKSTVANNRAAGTSSGTRAYGGGVAYAPVDNVGVSMPLEIRGSTISANTAAPSGGDTSYGGGIYYEPVSNVAGSDLSLEISNSTITANRADGNSSLGGGIFEEAVRNAGTDDKTLTNVTLADNSAPDGTGGGIYFTGIAPVFQPVPTFTNSIVAGNSAASLAESDCSEAAVSGGDNLERHSSCGFTGTGDLEDTEPKLHALADNGGPTKTQALRPSSAAVDAAAYTTCPPRDQRGVHRPQGPHCDIGAFELKH